MSSEDIEPGQQVVGADGMHVGTVDRIEDGAIVLARDEGANAHVERRIRLDEVDRVGVTVRIRRPAREVFAKGEADVGDDPLTGAQS